MNINNKLKVMLFIGVIIIVLTPILKEACIMKFMGANISNSSVITGKISVENSTIKIKDKTNIGVDFQVLNKKREIVFLIDNSESMRDGGQTNGSYYKSVKLLEDYINTIDLNNTDIAIVPYSVTAYNKNSGEYYLHEGIKEKEFYTNKEELSEAISFLKRYSGNLYDNYRDPNYNSNGMLNPDPRVSGASNIGDALRIGYSILNNGDANKQKDIILLSDCDANMYTRSGWKQYYLGDELFNSSRMYIDEWSENNRLETEAMEYIVLIGQKINDAKNIKTHIVNFSADQEKAQAIKEACGGDLLASISSYHENVVDNNFKIVQDKKLINILNSSESDSIPKNVKLKIDIQSEENGNIINGFEQNDIHIDMDKIPNSKIENGKLNVDLECSYDINTQNLIIPKVNIDIFGNKEGTYTIKGTVSYIDSNGNLIEKELNDTILNIISSYISFKKTIDKEQYNLREEININYSIIPKNIKFNAQNKDLDIVLVIDRSDSMKRYLDNSTTRLKAVQLAANQFIDDFNDYEGNVNIGLVDFEYFSTVQSELTNKDGFENIKNKINSITPYGGTNIGDGLRRAYWMLKNNSNKNTEKYIVFLTDGDPNGYTLKNEDYMYDDTANGSIKNDWDGPGRSLEYAKKIGEMIEKDKEANIKSYMIAFTTDATSNKLKEICDITNDGEEAFYRESITKEGINEIYQNLSKSIQKDLYIKNLIIEEFLPQGIVPVLPLPDGFMIDNNNPQKIIGKIRDVHYMFNPQTGEYNAEPINIKIRVKGIKDGEYVLGGKNLDGNETSIINYKNIFGDDELTAFDPLNISILKDNSKILKQGIFTKGNPLNQYIYEGNGTLNVVSGIKTNIAMIVDCKSDAPDISLNISPGIKQEYITFKKYRLNNGIIEMNSIEEFSPTTYFPGETKLISDEFSFKNGEKYIIVYEITPEIQVEESISIKSNIDYDKKNGKETTLIISELPDLF